MQFRFTNVSLQDVVREQIKYVVKKVKQPVIVESTQMTIRGLVNKGIEWKMNQPDPPNFHDTLFSLKDKFVKESCTIGFCLSDKSEPVFFSGHVESEIQKPYPYEEYVEEI